MVQKYWVLIILGILVSTGMHSRVWAAESASGMQQMSQNDTSADTGFEDDSADDLFDEYQDDAYKDSRVPDPLYYVNYAMYTVNDRLYFYVLKPVASGYKAVVPVSARRGISHFFHNLLFPVRFVNNLLQGKLEQASDEIGIFLVNSTAGILGFNQVAQKHLAMHTKSEDLGQTLGTWHIKDGFYLVLPFLGPSTLRDTVGRVGDYFITPVNYVEPWELDLGLGIVDTINQTSFRLGDYEDLKKASLDPYTAIRNAYIQNRKKKITE
jgi:phospholipid-binding lipoprotein MlaA